MSFSVTWTFWNIMIYPWYLYTHANLINTRYTTRSSCRNYKTRDIVLQMILIHQSRQVLILERMTSTRTLVRQGGQTHVYVYVSEWRCFCPIYDTLSKLCTSQPSQSHAKMKLLLVFLMICAITQPYNYGQQSYRSSTLDCY